MVKETKARKPRAKNIEAADLELVQEPEIKVIAEVISEPEPAKGSTLDDKIALGARSSTYPVPCELISPVKYNHTNYRAGTRGTVSGYMASGDKVSYKIYLMPSHLFIWADSSLVKIL